MGECECAGRAALWGCGDLGPHSGEVPKPFAVAEVFALVPLSFSLMDDAGLRGFHASDAVHLGPGLGFSGGRRDSGIGGPDSSRLVPKA